MRLIQQIVQQLIREQSMGPELLTQLEGLGVLTDASGEWRVWPPDEDRPNDHPLVAPDVDGERDRLDQRWLADELAWTLESPDVGDDEPPARRRRRRGPQRLTRDGMAAAARQTAPALAAKLAVLQPVLAPLRSLGLALPHDGSGDVAGFRAVMRAASSPDALAEATAAACRNVPLASWIGLARCQLTHKVDGALRTTSDGGRVADYLCSSDHPSLLWIHVQRAAVLAKVPPYDLALAAAGARRVVLAHPELLQRGLEAAATAGQKPGHDELAAAGRQIRAVLAPDWFASGAEPETRELCMAVMRGVGRALYDRVLGDVVIDGDTILVPHEGLVSALREHPARRFRAAFLRRATIEITR